MESPVVNNITFSDATSQDFANDSSERAQTLGILDPALSSIIDVGIRVFSSAASATANLASSAAGSFDSGLRSASSQLNTASYSGSLLPAAVLASVVLVPFAIDSARSAVQGYQEHQGRLQALSERASSETCPQKLKAEIAHFRRQIEPLKKKPSASARNKAALLNKAIAQYEAAPTRPIFGVHQNKNDETFSSGKEPAWFDKTFCNFKASAESSEEPFSFPDTTKEEAHVLLASATDTVGDTLLTPDTPKFEDGLALQHPELAMTLANKKIRVRSKNAQPNEGAFSPLFVSNLRRVLSPRKTVYGRTFDCTNTNRLLGYHKATPTPSYSNLLFVAPPKIEGHSNKSKTDRDVLVDSFTSLVKGLRLAREHSSAKKLVLHTSPIHGSGHNNHPVVTYVMQRLAAFYTRTDIVQHEFDKETVEQGDKVFSKIKSFIEDKTLIRRKVRNTRSISEVIDFTSKTLQESILTKKELEELKS